MKHFTTAKKVKTAFLAKSTTGAAREAYRQTIKDPLPEHVQKQILSLAREIYALGFSHAVAHYFHFAELNYNDLFSIRPSKKKQRMTGGSSR